MCVTVPGRVVSVDASGATVEGEGRRRRASTLLCPDVAVGDWVMVAAGTLVQVLTPADAESIRDALLEAVRLTDSQEGATNAFS